jgi:hypothetical protein
MCAVMASQTVGEIAQDASVSGVIERDRKERNAAVRFFATTTRAQDTASYRAAVARAELEAPGMHIGGDRDRINVNTADRVMLTAAARKAGYREPEKAAAFLCAWRGDRRTQEISEEAFDYFSRGYPCKSARIGDLAELSLVKTLGDDAAALARLKALLSVREDDTMDLYGASQDVLSCVYAYIASLIGVDTAAADRYAAHAVRVRSSVVFSSYAAFFSEATRTYAGNDRDVFAAVLSAARPMFVSMPAVAEVSFAESGTVFRYDLRSKRMRNVIPG